MTSYTKIVLIWVILMGLISLGLVSFTHFEVSLLGSVTDGFKLLLGIICFFVVSNEPRNRNRPLFVNFAIAFSVNVLNFIFLFAGKSIITSEPLASFYFYQYVNSCLVVCFLSFALIYVVCDTIFDRFRTYQKYSVALLITGVVTVHQYYPIFSDPQYLYHTEDITDFRTVDRALVELKEEGVQDLSAERISEKTTLNSWRDGKPVGFLPKPEEIRRISFILPYLEGLNYTLLLYKPVHEAVIHMNVLSIMCILLYFGYQYLRDPPKGAYIEKIMALFLPLCLLEILHYLSYVTASDHARYLDLFGIAQYLIILNLISIGLFLGFRLHFITSIQGKFYERKLALDAGHITRWRDWIDNLVLRHFFKRKASKRNSVAGQSRP